MPTISEAVSTSLIPSLVFVFQLLLKCFRSFLPPMRTMSSGTNEGVNFIKCFGGEKAVHEKEMYLANILKEDLSIIKNVLLYDFMQGTRKSPVVSFGIKNTHSEEVSTFLDKHSVAVRAGYHCSFLAHSNYNTEEYGVVRVTPGIFNTKKDVKTLSFLINRFAIEDKM